MSKRISRGVVFGLLVGIFILSGPVLVAIGAEPFVDSGKIVLSVYTDIQTMDPADAFVWYSVMVTRSAYEGLVEYDIRDFSIKPALAESWEVTSDGGTFRLRKGVKFHDGTEFKADAVKFNLERIKAINKGPATWVKDIKDVEVIDDYTVRLVTTKNWAFLLDVLASPWCFMIASPTEVKKHATKEDPWANKWMHSHTCGTGPYMVKEWVPIQYIKMVRYENYRKGWPGKHFTEVVYQVNKEDSTERMLITKGAIDLINDMAAEYWDILDADPNITTKVYTSLAEQFVLMNNARGPLTDKNLRWALTYAIDYEACRAVLNAPAGGLLVGAVYQRDLKKAMEYKNKSAYAGKEVELLLTYVSGVEHHRKWALILQNNLKEIGIKLNLKSLTWPTFAKEVYGDPKEAGDMYPFYASSIITDPYGVLYKVLHSNSIKPGGANLGYSNPKFDALLDQAATTLDRKKRMSLYEEAKKLAVDDAVYAWLLMFPYIVIYRDDIKVYPYTQLGDPLANIFYFYDMYRK